MLAVLLIVGGFIPLIHANEFQLSMLSAGNQVITGQFFDSLLLSLPPCTYAGKNVDLEYSVNDINNTLLNIFTVPACNSVGDPKGPTALSRNLGYQLMNLNGGTQYKINYKIGNSKSTTLTANTRTANNTEGELSGFSGRSAAMIVITIILSVAMFILLIGIIVGSLVSPSED